MQKSFEEIKRLIAKNALHRKLFRLKEMLECDIVNHAKEEMCELSDATSEEHRFEELCDVMGLLLHLAIRYGKDIDDIDNELMRKLYLRFPGE